MTVRLTVDVGFYDKFIWKMSVAVLVNSLVSSVFGLFIVLGMYHHYMVRYMIIFIFYLVKNSEIKPKVRNSGGSLSQWVSQLAVHNQT